MKRHPGTRVQVTGGGSGTGLAALINGSTHIALSSRPITADEAKALREQSGAPLEEVVVARDGITFYVHESNPVDALTLEQLRAIYLGDVNRWTQVGGRDAPIVVYSRESSSGTYLFVKETLLGGEDYTSYAQTLPGTAAVVYAVAREKNAIGYGGSAYARGTKVLKVKQGTEEVAPTREDILAGRYPLSRALYFYLRGEPSGELRAFVEFALSSEGQALAEQVGYFPVK